MHVQFIKAISLLLSAEEAGMVGANRLVDSIIAGSEPMDICSTSKHYLVRKLPPAMALTLPRGDPSEADQP